MSDRSDSPQVPNPARPAEPPTVELPAAGESREPPTVDLTPESTPGAHTPAASASTPPATRQVGDYELLSEIQRGGMGVVYRARERRSGRLVALKMMLDETVYGDADLSRFVLEARATAELHHPGIVAIHAWGEHEGHPFYTMDFVSGEPLSRLLQNGPLPVERTVRYLIGITRAVAAAHAQGIVHRDLKPSNIMIDTTDQPRVLDFGLAKRRHAVAEVETDAPAPLPRTAVTPGQTPKTERGAILGTPAYMSPEQARGEHFRVCPATDVHALGTMLHEMLTGHPPFQAETTMETLMQVADSPPPPLRSQNPRVPAPLEAIYARCLAKDPHDRYADAGALADELERYWRGATHSRHFARLTLFAGALVVALQLLELGSLGGSGNDSGWLYRLADWVSATCGPAVQEGTKLLALLASMFVFLVLPALAWLALAVWLVAWTWYSGRGLLTAILAAALSVLLALVWPLAGGSQVFPVLLGAMAFLALATSGLRWWMGANRWQRERASSDKDPYLQRLFVARGEHAPKAIRQKNLSAVRHADVEPGKTLMKGQHCLLRWGRQLALDRAVLIWLDTTPAQSGIITPGVLVRHSQVLTLHAVGPCAEGRFLVTEPVAAAPLAEVLERRPLTAAEAITIATGVARAIQAFHDQGACHGRLSAEWILVRGECEPLLCPCGVPSQSAADRQADLGALARLLLDWLPPRGQRWDGHSRAALYRVCDGALEGRYACAADLAVDLENAFRIAEARHSERWTNGFAGTLYLLGLLAVALYGLAKPLGLSTLLDLAPHFLNYQFLLFVPGILLYGYSHGRTVVHRLRHPLHITARSSWLGRRTFHALAIVLALAAVPAFVACLTSAATHHLSSVWTVVLGLSVMVGYWSLGILFAGVRTFGEVLFGSLQLLRTGASDPFVDEWEAESEEGDAASRQ